MLSLLPFPSPKPWLLLPCSQLSAGLADFDALGTAAVAAEEGGSALIGCKVPESHPKAQIRFQVRGKWLEQSTGEVFCAI